MMTSSFFVSSISTAQDPSVSGAQSIENGLDSFDSLFTDDELDEDDADAANSSDDEGFTIIDDCVPPRPAGGLEVDTRHHLRRGPKIKSPKTTDKMKNKIVSFWHNVKYGSWPVKVKSEFNKRKSIFLLSKCYDCREANDVGDEKTVQRILVQFKQDFTSRIWFTYRQGFTYIADTHHSSDTGWGCMIRSGQMMLAQALVTHYLGRDWDMFTNESESTLVQHREIIRWFADRPSSQSPFSLHRLVTIGKAIDKRAGQWFGPAHVATLLEKASRISGEFVPLLKQICVYVAPDCAIYKKDVVDLVTKGASNSTSPGSSCSENWKALVIIIPVRLGADSVNPIYIPCLKGLFTHKNFLGIIGGTPGHSLYFIGFQDNKMIVLDPHLVQDTVDVSHREFPVQSYHCVYPKKISFANMDPSCALGFYCKTKPEYEHFLNSVQPYLLPPSEEITYPMFAVIEGSRDDAYSRVT